MTDNELPESGRKRNVALMLLTGWTLRDISLPIHATRLCWFHPHLESREDTIDYCGNDAACFALLVELLRREIYLEFFPEHPRKIYTEWDTLGAKKCIRCEAQNDLPDDSIGWRDAITAAAWKALTAQKEMR